MLSSTEEKEWVIDSFLFEYKKEDYVVILKLYNDTERKPSEYAKVKLGFIRANNIKESIQAYADFYEIHFNSSNEFANFFNINRGNANRNLFVDFSEIFSKFSLLSPLKNSGFSRAKKLLNFARYSPRSRRVKSSSLIINALFDLVGFALKLRACALFSDESAHRKGVGEALSRHDLRGALQI